ADPHVSPPDPPPGDSGLTAADRRVPEPRCTRGSPMPGPCLPEPPEPSGGQPRRRERQPSAHSRPRPTHSRVQYLAVYSAPTPSSTHTRDEATTQQLYLMDPKARLVPQSPHPMASATGGVSTSANPGALADAPISTNTLTSTPSMNPVMTDEPADAATILWPNSDHLMSHRPRTNPPLPTESPTPNRTSSAAKRRPM
ncbi:unnamed protein product, partial [Lampetra planeri]